MSAKKPKISIIYNPSKTREIARLIEATQTMGQQEREYHFKNGRSVTIFENNKIVRIKPDGREILVGK